MLEQFRSKLAKNGILELTIRVHPNAKKTHLKSILEDDSLKIDIASPADGGKANRELIRFLSDEFNIPKSSIEILCGETARVKTVRIQIIP